jgi:hypothetical protein
MRRDFRRQTEGSLGTPATSYVLQSLAWVAGILLVFVPIAVRRYRRAV